MQVRITNNVSDVEIYPNPPNYLFIATELVEDLSDADCQSHIPGMRRCYTLEIINAEDD